MVSHCLWLRIREELHQQGGKRIQEFEYQRKLNSLRDRVHEFHLLVKVLVVRKVELVKSGSRNLPV